METDPLDSMATSLPDHYGSSSLKERLQSCHKLLWKGHNHSGS